MVGLDIFKNKNKRQKTNEEKKDTKAQHTQPKKEEERKKTLTRIKFV
jgi:hypothetical protein